MVWSSPSFSLVKALNPFSADSKVLSAERYFEVSFGTTAVIPILKFLMDEVGLSSCDL